MYIEKIPDDAKQIKDSYDYIDPYGNVYGIERRKNGKTGKPFTKTLGANYGYKYCGISYKDGKNVSKRVHRLVAETFIPNPNGYPIVMHSDNDKSNNSVSNLKWGIIRENTKQSVDDGLLKNDKGFEDSQSIPCDCYDTLTNEFVGSFGSVTIAAKEMGITIEGILYQLRNPDKPIRKKFYFVPYGARKISHEVIAQYDFTTDEEIRRFTTIGKASEVTGIPTSTISHQVKMGKKPLWAEDSCYFKRITLG